MANEKIWLLLLVIVLAFGMIVVGCDNGSGGDTSIDDGKGDSSGSGSGGGGASIGCSTLSLGTKCGAQSICGNRFLCQTGQGSDNNCTTSCSCQ
jgi:hypothetical protein